ncbi:MAG: methyltransferase domain-containing protein [Erysipelotrichaceae bacterium]|nr:methyltransferase domain-containing protein [Erysipelotrichaceae bacterium]
MDILCPICKNKLYKSERSYRCENGHNYDLSKEGYLNLNLRNSKNTGDNPEMIKARQRFLEKGYYAFLRDAVNEFLNEDDTLVDLACGEGYYTSAFKCHDKIGIDLSKSGLKIAAKNDKSTLYLLNSIFRDPLRDKCADKVVTIFAPIAEKEIVRILKDDGRFILVRPDVDHLFELKQLIYAEPYRNQAEDIIIEGLKREIQLRITQTAKVAKEDLQDLFMMTPYYNTTSPDDKAKLKEAEATDISFCFIIDIFKKG